ncbi:hypothetical protein [Streptomyces sp. B6B3]|uniref:hypothetical protein n=1 Tax=Streptomyces sp. B6B3 TaxID=3153570 RepID=UPI00325C3C79
MTAEQQHNPFRPPDDSVAAAPSQPPSGYGAPPPSSPTPPHVQPPAGPPPGQAPGYGAQPGYGHPQSAYGAPPVPGAQPGYGAPPGYGHPQPMPGWGGAPGWPQGPVGPRNGLGTAGLVLGIIAAVLSCTFVLSPVALILGILALVFGLVGAGRARRGQATNRVAALGGLWTGAGATLVAAVLTVVLFVWASQPIEVESEAGSAYLAEALDEVAYADGVTVVIGSPQVSPDGAAVTVTAQLANDSDTDADLLEGGLTGYADGEELPGDAVELEGMELGTVPPGDGGTVVYTVAVPAGTEELGIDFSPGSGYEDSYWVFTLSGGPAEEDPTGPSEEDPGGELPGDEPPSADV